MFTDRMILARHEAAHVYATLAVGADVDHVAAEMNHHRGVAHTLDTDEDIDRSAIVYMASIAQGLIDGVARHELVNHTCAGDIRDLTARWGHVFDLSCIDGWVAYAHEHIAPYQRAIGIAATWLDERGVLYRDDVYLALAHADIPAHI